jgi:hypothetical protein
MSGTSDFGTFGRYTELPLDKMTAEQKRAYEFTVKQRGEVPGPYKIWLQNPKLIEFSWSCERYTAPVHATICRVNPSRR